ncbi:MAG: 5-formyltetrahydrofolate cyclo-ligase [Actinomycetia bacterium]|nr:5-formyltetrahydrofolate cyclo-ligase [Actinomycetes bacterium]
MEEFGISRGTLRRAIEELTRDGLLSAEQGRGTYVNQEERVRRVVWQRLETVARPDSRFDLDLRRFVPDFADRERAEAAVIELDTWSGSETVFIAPDNSLERLRELALAAGKRVLVPTFGLQRGFVLLDGGILDTGERALAATLDGMERFGRKVGPGELRSVGRVDTVVTGATAITMDGRHIGGGQRYLALEWSLLERLDVVDATVPVIGVVHDCQVIDELVQADPDCLVDLIVTPTRIIRCREGGTITPLRRRRT